MQSPPGVELATFGSAEANRASRQISLTPPSLLHAWSSSAFTLEVWTSVATAMPWQRPALTLLIFEYALSLCRKCLRTSAVGCSQRTF